MEKRHVSSDAGGHLFALQAEQEAKANSNLVALVGWPDLLRRLEPEKIVVCFLKTIVGHSPISPEATLSRLKVKGRTVLIFLSIIPNVILTATVAVPRNSGSWPRYSH